VTFDTDKSRENGIVVTFDPVVESIVVTVNHMCNAVQCQGDRSTIVDKVQSVYHTKLLKELRADYKRYIGSLYLPGTGKYDSTKANTWVEQASPGMQASYADTFREARALAAGFLAIRAPCKSQPLHIIAEKEGCEFAVAAIATMTEMGLMKEQSGHVDLVDADFHDLTTLARTMFNKKFWIQSEALASYALFANLDTNRTHPDPVNQNMLLTILSEVSANRGRLMEAAHFSSASLEAVPTNELKNAIGRLRTVLAIPAMPPDYEEANKYRTEIISDLWKFSRSVRAEGVHIDRHILSTFVAATPFHMAHQGLNDAPFQRALAEAIHALSPDVYHVAERLRSGPPPPHRDRPLRVGIISAHMGQHSIGKMFIELFVNLIQRRDELNVHTFAFALDHHCKDVAGCAVSMDEPITGYLAKSMGADYHRLPHSVQHVEKAIDATQLDVLLYADLGMEFTTYVLAHARLAPLQVAWWGHPITSGLPSIDYFFGLDHEVPWAADHYTEQHVRMDYMNSAPFVRTHTDPVSLVEAFGIPEGSKFMAVLGRLFKLHPTFDRTLARILAHVPDAYILVIAEAALHTNQMLWERLQETMAFHPGTAERVRFIDYKNYNKMLHQAEGVLDTFPYGGCLTTHDALSNRVPMVTLPLEHVRGRYSFGMYSQMGHMDLVASNQSHYEALAIRLLTDNVFRKEQIELIDDAYQHRFHKNRPLAREWVDFFRRALER